MLTQPHKWADLLDFLFFIELVFLWNPFCKKKKKVHGNKWTKPDRNLKRRSRRKVSSRVYISVWIQIFKQRQKKISAYSSVTDFLYFPACLQISLETLTTTFVEWDSVRRHKLLQSVQSKKGMFLLYWVPFLFFSPLLFILITLF